MYRKTLILALTVVGISLTPYCIGWIVQTEEQIFSGFIVNLADFHAYLTVMRQGMGGSWRFVSLYNPAHGQGVWFYTFYILLGQLVRWTGLSPLVVYHGARVVFSVLFLLVACHFVCMCLDRTRVQWCAILLISFSSGLGWLQEMISPTVQGGVSPIDFWLVEAHTFPAILTYPHFVLAWALLLIAFWSVLAYQSAAKADYLLLGGGAALLATAIHPTLSLLMGTVLAVCGLSLWVTEGRFPIRWAKGGIPVVLGAGGMAAYLLVVIRSDPILRSWSETHLATPAPQHLVWGYGLLLPLAGIGAVDVARERNRHGVFLIVWTGVTFLLAYTPLNLQRRLLEGVHIPICLLAAVGLRRCLLVLAQTGPVRRIAEMGYPRRRAMWLIGATLVAFTSISNIYLVASAGIVAWQRRSDFFLPRDQVSAFEWLDENLVEEDVILASYETGNLIPAWTGRRVFVGHWAESADRRVRTSSVMAFLDGNTGDDWRQTLLSQYAISYVFVGRKERELGDFDAASANYLRKVYSVGEVSVYQVLCSEGG